MRIILLLPLVARCLETSVYASLTSEKETCIKGDISSLLIVMVSKSPPSFF